MWCAYEQWSSNKTQSFISRRNVETTQSDQVGNPKCSRSSQSEVFLRKDVLKICGKFTGEHPCRSVISNIIEIALRHGCCPVNLLHNFRTSFLGTPLGGFWKYNIEASPYLWFPLHVTSTLHFHSIF